ncbi:hypothetical protein MUCCIDRAFT_83333 [Mucor lusitanicus CBS 277.49]|uniref:Rab-GAP TBC domain-containing protein n=1 Tax=Mucor lusitanicus CBS 277.49 TaxID=747725 RepID=A0A168JTE5_MUCCL|nr:hypothetical protein MUCCIDRAFT_83333 [Mucor lusitanicus CBS 277.49]
MSLYEMHYVLNASEKSRVKEQQATIQKALQELSIKSKLEQQHEHEKLLSRQHVRAASTKHSTVNFDLWLHSTNYTVVTNECRPYSPYCSGDTASSDAVSTCTTRSNRQRTPSMVSASSSYMSENTASSCYDRDDDSCYSTPAYKLSERDIYGFKRPTQWVKASKLIEFEQRYKLIQKKQAKSWSKLLANNNQQWPDLCPQLSRYVRKGIPHPMRAKVWMHYSGASKKLRENPGRYSLFLEIVDGDDAYNEYADAINKDLHRTFPDNSKFACDVQHPDGSTTVEPHSNEKIQQLRRVLLAFSVYSPNIGYCQSLNFLAGFLLLVLSEEETFWMLVTIVHDIFPINMFDTTMEGANTEQTVLMMMVYEKMPGVWAKIGNKRCFWECEQNEELPPITLMTSHWFLTLFINILPVETVLRIWDCFFVGEGCKVLYKAALTILKLNEQRIRDAEDSVDTFQLLQNMPKRLIDCDQFLKLSDEDIESKRTLFKNRKIQRKLDHSRN